MDMKLKDMLPLVLLGLGLVILGSGTSFMFRPTPFKREEEKEILYEEQPNIWQPISIQEYKLTTEQVKALETVEETETITSEIMQPLQPYPTAAIVTTSAIFEWSATQQQDRYWIMSNGGRTQAEIDVIMIMRDNMRANGYGIGKLTLIYLDGRTETKMVYA